MTTKYDQYKALATQLNQPHRDAVANHFRIQHQVGQRAETVVNHEGWQTYLDHLSQVRSNLEQERTRTQEKMGKGPEVGDTLIALKFKLRDLDGEIRGLTTAIDLVPGLIERGREAGKALESFA